MQSLDKPAAPTTAEKICYAIGESFRNLGYVAFVVGVIGFAIASATVVGGAPAAFIKVPACIAIAGGVSHLLGTVLQSLGSKSISYIV